MNPQNIDFYASGRSERCRAVVQKVLDRLRQHAPVFRDDPTLGSGMHVSRTVCFRDVLKRLDTFAYASSDAMYTECDAIFYNAAGLHFADSELGQAAIRAETIFDHAWRRVADLGPKTPRRRRYGHAKACMAHEE